VNSSRQNFILLKTFFHNFLQHNFFNTTFLLSLYFSYRIINMPHFFHIIPYYFTVSYYISFSSLFSNKSSILPSHFINLLIILIYQFPPIFLLFSSIVYLHFLLLHYYIIISSLFHYTIQFHCAIYFHCDNHFL
jgi:hypothetical protein